MNKKLLSAFIVSILLSSCASIEAKPSPSQCAGFIQTAKDLRSGYAKTDAETTAMFYKYADICQGK